MTTAEAITMEKPTVVDRTHRAIDCKTCQGRPEGTELVNHSLMWHDGDIICSAEGCGRFVRDFDAG